MSENSTRNSIEKTNTKRSGYTLTAVFSEVEPAKDALNDLKATGFSPDSISFVTRDRSTQRELNDDTGIDSADASLLGSLGGGTLGAAIGWLAAGGVSLIPGIGPVITAGAVASILGGAVVGGSIGGIAGALMGSGLPQNEAREYEEFVKGGQTVITVNAADDKQLHSAGDIFLRNKAGNVRYYDLSSETVGPGNIYKGDSNDS